MDFFELLSQTTRDLIERRRERRQRRQDAREEEQISRIEQEQEQVVEPVQRELRNLTEPLVDTGFTSPLTQPIAETTLESPLTQPFQDVQKQQREQAVERLQSRFEKLEGPVRTPERIQQEAEEIRTTEQLGSLAPVVVPRTRRERVAERLREFGAVPTSEFEQVDVQPVVIQEFDTDIPFVSDAANELVDKFSEQVQVAAPIIKENIRTVVSDRLEQGRENVIGLLSPTSTAEERKEAFQNIQAGFRDVTRGGAALTKTLITEIFAGLQRIGKGVLYGVWRPILGEEAFAKQRAIDAKAELAIFGRETQTPQETYESAYTAAQDAGLTDAESFIISGLAFTASIWDAADIGVTDVFSKVARKELLQKVSNEFYDDIAKAVTIDEVSKKLDDLNLPEEAKAIVLDDLLEAKTREEVKNVFDIKFFAFDKKIDEAAEAARDIVVAEREGIAPGLSELSKKFGVEDDLIQEAQSFATAEEFVDSVTGRVFHGSSSPVGEILSEDDFYSGGNIYGQGFYTTDNFETAVGYTRKGDGVQPTIYDVTKIDETNLYDLDSPMGPSVVSAIEDSVADLAPGITEDFTSLRGVMDELRDMSASGEFTRDSVQEVFTSIRKDLEGLGFKGYKHVGGKITGNQPHTVNIFWDPKDISVKKIPFKSRKEILDFYNEATGKVVIPRDVTLKALDAPSAVKANIIKKNLDTPIKREIQAARAINREAQGLSPIIPEGTPTGKALVDAAETKKALREGTDIPVPTKERPLISDKSPITKLGPENLAKVEARNEIASNLIQKTSRPVKTAFQIQQEASQALLPKTTEGAKLLADRKRIQSAPEYTRDTDIPTAGGYVPEVEIAKAADVSPALADELEKALTTKDLRDTQGATGLGSKALKAFRESAAYENTAYLLTNTLVEMDNLLKRKELEWDDSTNPVLKEALLHGATEFAQKQADDEYKNMVKGLRVYAKKNGFKFKDVLNDLEQSIYARHAKDFNLEKQSEGPKRAQEIRDKLEKKNIKPDQVKALEEELDTVVGLYQEGDYAGITTDKADDILRTFAEKYENDPVLEQYAKIVRDRSKQTLEIAYNQGLISKDAYELWKIKYPNHVPLFREVKDLEMDTFFTAAFLPQAFKTARGSKRKVQNTIASTYFMHNQTIARGLRNEYYDTIAKLVETNHKNKELYEDKIKRVVEYRPGDKLGSKDVGFFRDGKRYVIEFESQTLKNAVDGSAGLITIPFVNSALRGVKKYTRFYSGLLTRFNPDFWASNKVRDMIDAGLVGAAQKKRMGTYDIDPSEIAKKARKIGVKEVNALRGWTVAQRYYSKGAVDAETKAFEEFLKLGGTTGGLGLSTLEGVQESFEKHAKKQMNVFSRNADKVVGFVDNINEVFENSTRFTTYLNAIEDGYTKEAAAYLAKISSINFNRRGAVGPVMNALYMFFNASVQGTVNMTRILQDPITATTVTGVMLGAAYAEDRVNSLFDPEWRDHIPDYITDRFLVFVTGIDKQGNLQYIKIPIPYSLVPIRVGTQGVMHASEDRRTVKDIATNILTATTQSASPIQAGSIKQAITPDAFDLPVALAENVNWKGSKIRPSPDESKKPYENVYPGFEDEGDGAKQAIALSKWLYNNLRIKANPYSLLYAYEHLNAGGLKTLTNAVKTGIELDKDGNPVNPSNIPIGKAFFGESPIEQQDWQEARSYASEIRSQIQGVPIEDREAWLRTFIINNPDMSYSDVRKTYDGQFDRKLPAVSFDLTKRDKEASYKSAMFLYNLSLSDDPADAEKVTEFLSRQSDDIRRAYVDYDFVFSTQGQKVSTQDVLNFYKERGVDLGVYKTTTKDHVAGQIYKDDVEKVNKVRSLLTRERLGLNPVYDKMVTDISEIKNGAEDAPEPEVIIRMAQILMSKNALSAGQIKTLEGNLDVAVSTRKVNNLLEQLRDPTVDNLTIVGPQFIELTEEEQKTFYDQSGVEGARLIEQLRGQ